MQQNGFNLIELVIVMAVGGILLALGLPALKTVIDSTKTKAAAESMLSGLRQAKSEAIRRNTPMRFQLVSTLDNTCALAINSGLWVVNQDENAASERSPVGKCGAATLSPADNDVLNAAEPYIAYKSDSKVFIGLTVASDASLITFNPLGQVMTNFDGSGTLRVITITPDNPDAKTWEVRIQGTNGSLKFCDPALAAGAPLACS